MPVDFQQSTEQEPYRPVHNEFLLKQLVQQYNKLPASFKPELVDQLEKDSQFYGVQFRRNIEDEEFKLLDTVQQVGAGFLSGFTTFEIGEEPKNAAERIARSVSHLAGFVGFVPTGAIGAVTKIPTILKTAKFLQGKSVPMLAANLLTKKAAKIASQVTDTAVKGRAGATQSAVKFLQKTNVSDTIQGAFHLGVATSVSVWQGGIDEMMHGFIGGAQTGAAFKMIGNLLKAPGVPVPKPFAKLGEMTGNQQAEVAVRTIASSLYTGLPSTLRGDTTPEQIYEYLLGAYFGIKMTPAEQTKRDRHIYNMITTRKRAPEEVEGWDKLSEREQKMVNEYMVTFTGEGQGAIISKEILKKYQGADLEAMLATPMGETPEGVVKPRTYPTSKSTTQDDIIDVLVKNEIPPPEAWEKLSIEDKIFFGEAIDASNLRGWYTWGQLNRLSTEQLQAIGDRYSIPKRKSLDDMTLAAEILYAQEKIPESEVFNVSIEEQDAFADVVDTGDFRKIDVKLESFVRRELDFLYKDLPTQFDQERAVFSEIDRIAQFMAQEGALTSTTPEGARYPNRAIDSKKVIEELERRHGKAIGPEGVRSMTLLINRRNQEQQIPVLESNVWEHETPTGWTERVPHVSFMAPYGGKAGTPVNTAGDSRRVKTVESMIDKIWKGMMGEDVAESAYYVAGDFVVPKDGWKNTIDWYRYKDELETRMPNKGTETFDRIVWDIMQKLSTGPKDLYYFGGVADKERSVFLHHHPETALKGETALLNEQFTDIKAAFGPTFDKIYAAGEKAFKFKYKTNNTEYYKRSFVSNFLWDVAMNGFTVPSYRAKAEQPLYRGAAPVKYGAIKKTRVGGLVEDIVPAFTRYDAEGNVIDININRAELKKKYNEKAWTKPKVKGVKPLPEDTFANEKEWEVFIIGHEQGHASQGRGPEKGTPEYAENENLMNEYGLEAVQKYRDNVDAQRMVSPLARRKILKQVLADGFINDAKGFNKRAQIWFTSGLRSDPIKIEENLRSADPDGGLIDGEFKYIIFGDAKGPVNDKSLAREYGEGSDGGVITRDDVIFSVSKEIGMPEADMQGQSKSFIVSPRSDVGALLGKYMFHSAGPELSAAMREKDIHFLIPTSAAKQQGLRKTGNYEMNADGTMDLQGSTIYGFRPDELHTIYGETQDRHMIQPQRVMKQMFTGLSPSLMASKVDAEIIKDMTNRLVDDAYMSSPYGAKLLTRFHENPKDKAIQKEFLDAMDTDEIGVSAINDIIHTRGHEVFADKIYTKLLGINERMAHEYHEMGEITEKELEDFLGRSRNFRSATDRFMSIASDLSKDGEPTLGTTLHKHNKGFVGTLIKNWMVHRATRPLVLNSLSARMRPYDKALQKKFNEESGNFGEEMFYLDDYYKDMRIYSDVVGIPELVNADRNGRKWIKLQDLYDAHYGPDRKWGENEAIYRHVEEIFNGLATRVPIDSASGVRKLKFMGFTGRKGHGILLHPRVMRALAGADLDGDKATLYFGGRDEDGGGHGFKESWKDLYHKQKDEYRRYYYKADENLPIAKRRRKKVLTEGEERSGKWIPYTTDNKREPFVGSETTPADLLTVNEESLPKEYQDPYFMGGLLNKFPNDKGQFYYHPIGREWMSEAAGRGRQQLSTAASQKNVMQGAHSMLSAMPEQAMSHYTVLNIGDYDSPMPIGVYWTEKAKTDPESTELYRDLSRASIALPSDPMDEIGLRRRNKFFELIYDSIFDIKIDNFEHLDKRTKRWAKTKLVKAVANAKADVEGNIPVSFSSAPSNKQLIKLKKTGIYGMFSDANRAYYGKDWTTGKQFTPSESRRLASKLAEQDAEVANTHLPLIARTMSKNPHYDNMISRLKVEHKKDGTVALPELEKLYREYEKNIREFDVLQNALNRKTMAVLLKGNPYLYKIVKGELWFPKKQKDLADDIDAFRAFFTETPISKRKVATPYGKEKIDFWHATLKANKAIDGKDAVDYRREMIDRVVESGNDMVMQDMWDMISARIMRKNMEEGNISPERAAAIFKTASDIRGMAHRIGRDKDTDTRIDELDPDVEVSKNELFENDLQSAAMSQVKIDSEIASTKAALDLVDGKQIADQNKWYEHKLFDSFLAGSLHRGNIEKLRAQRIKKEQEGTITPAWERYYNKEMAGTASTGMDKMAFKSHAIDDVTIKEYITEYNKMFNFSIDAVSPAEKKRVEAEMAKAEEPQKVDGINTNLLEDPFRHIRGLQEAGAKHELDAEGQKILTELEDHLTFYHNSIGDKLPELVGGILSDRAGATKDLNTMDYQDWRDVNGFFKMIRTGDWADRNLKTGMPMPQSRYFRLFPEAVNRSMMIHEFNLAYEKGMYLTKENEWKEGVIAKPTHMAQRALNTLTFSTEQATRFSDIEIARYRNIIDPYVEGIPEGQMLFELAIAERERGEADRMVREYAMEEPERKAELHARAQEYYKRSNQLKKKYKWNELEGKIFTNNTIRKKLTGKEYVDEINAHITDQNVHMYRWMNGSKEYEGMFNLKNEKGENLYFDQNGNPTTSLTPGMEMMNVKAFIKFAREKIRGGEDISMSVGNSTMNRLIRQFQFNETKNLDHKRDISKLSIRDVGQIAPENYWSHMIFDKNIAEVAQKEAMEALYQKKGTMSEDAFNVEAQKILWRHKQLTGEWELEEAATWELYDEVSDHLKHIANNMTPDQHTDYRRAASLGPAHTRENHMPGWSYEPRVIDKYIRATSGAFNRALGQLISRYELSEWLEAKRPDYGEDLANAWERYFNIYINNASGYPAVLPKAYLKDPLLKVKGTMFSWWADNNVRTKMNNVLEKLDLTNKDIPKEMRGVSLQDLRNWGNLEAKYSMAALLFHPKTAMGNLYGGSSLTIQSVGLKTFAEAKNIKWLKSNLNKDFDSMSQWREYVESLGVVPEMITYEAGINPEAAKANVRRAMDEAVKLIRKDPEVKNKTLLGIAQDYGITESFWNKTAWFMKKSERVLRADAFMAHLIQAWKAYDGALPFNHPILTAHAKKGVKASQFLYNAPNRPMFAQTSLGKVLTRFQLWSWNSVRFRNDVIRDAQRYGWQEGTPEFERLRRTMQMDLFMLALSSVFTYSLFESALPAPWNWFQDTADWLFGNEKERDRAFFGAWPSGVAPLQMVTPVILRPLPALFRGLVDEDWSKLAGYTGWTMLPLGRVARDLFGEGNIIDNPIRAVEKLTGLPYMKFHREQQKEREDKPRTKGILGW